MRDVGEKRSLDGQERLAPLRATIGLAGDARAQPGPRQLLKVVERSHRRVAVDAAAQHAVVAHQVGIGLRADNTRELAGQPPAARWRIACERHARSQRADQGRRDVQREAQQRASARHRLVRVDGAAHLGTRRQHARMQAALHRRRQVALDAGQVAEPEHTHILRRHRQVVGGGRRDGDEGIVDPHHQVAAGRGEVALAGQCQAQVHDLASFSGVLHAMTAWDAAGAPVGALSRW